MAIGRREHMSEPFAWLADSKHRRRDLLHIERAVNRGQLGPADRPALEAALAVLEADGGLTARERHRVLLIRIALAVGPDEKGDIFTRYYLPGSSASGSVKSR